jgi:hypothetical protein
MSGCRRAMAGLAKVAVIQGRDIGGNQLSLAWLKTVGFMQQDMRKFSHRFRSLWTEGKACADSGQFFW